jgi:ABC-type multidrug transport system permease subunit
VISMCRFFKHLLLVFLIQQMAGGLFRAIAGLCRSMIIAHTGGALSLLMFFVLGGFLLPKGSFLVFFLFYSHRSIFSLLTSSSLPSHC